MTGAFLLFFLLSIPASMMGVTVPPEVPPEVKTSLGAVRGYWQVSATGKLVRKFVGIPYAAPPLGPRRFKPPEPALPWDGTFNATRYSISCIQKKIPIYGKHPYLKKFFGTAQDQVGEDCLTINIHAPEDTNRTYPVMVWIYGGGFARGNTENEAYEGTQLSAEEDVVVVTFNYRLNVFGFLYLDHPETPGNMGLMDQGLALKWTQQNIQYFNGDPNQVTLFGQSAGASSIGYHLLIPENQNLFQRAILQSGSPTSMFAVEKRQVLLERAKELLKDLGCPHYLDTNDNKTAALECLQGKDPFEIMDNEMAFGYDFIYVFRPVVDGTYIKDHPVKLMADSKNVKKVDIMIGTVKDEGTIFLANLLPMDYQLHDRINPKMSSLRSALEEDMGFEEMTSEIVMGLYSHGTKPNVVRDSCGIINDLFFVCPSQDVERGVKMAGGVVYKYYFLHRSKHLNLPLWMGAHHGIEVMYVFGYPLLPEQEYTPEERQFSRDVMRMWANFARTGNPNLNRDGRNSTITWPKFTLDDEEYLVLAPNSTAVGKHLRTKYCTFWNEIIPKMVKRQKTKHRGYVEIYRTGQR